MKNKYKVLFIVIAVLIILVSVLYYINYLQYNLKLIKRFAVPELTKTPDHKIISGYGVSFALSDSFIYITDTTDSLATKSFCLNYAGIRQENFNMPVYTGYLEPFNEDGLFYLSDSHELVYNDWPKSKVDFYALDGKFIRQKQFIRDARELLVDLSEFNYTKYYILHKTVHVSVNSGGKRGNPYKLILFEERPNEDIRIVKSIESSDQEIKFCWGQRVLQIDNNLNMMAVLEVKPKKYLITVHYIDKTEKIQVPSNKWKLPWQFADFLQNIVLGRDFFVLGFWTKDMTHPMRQKIYDLKGRYRGKLKFKDDPKNELIDIVGDRLVAFNPATSTISVYRIKVK